MSTEPHTIAELGHALITRDVTAEETTERCLSQIAERDPSINAFITVLAEDALEQAREADREIDAGHYRGPLHGVPISLKDLIDLRGTPTTAGSRIRREVPAAEDAVVTSRLRKAGAIFVGKTNLHEFAFGTTNEDSAFGPVRHPLDPDRSPGGSSGGSAASVLAGMSFASVGTDTGGSIRIPAAACGLVGLKPALQEIPLGGVVPLSSTMDHVGPICRSVEDARLMHDVLRGLDATQPLVHRGVRGLRMGVLRHYFLSLLDPQVATAFAETCSALEEAGVILDDVTIPHSGDITSVYLHIVLAEAAAYHAKTLESRPQDYTPNVRIRLEMGRYVLAEDYVRALRGREILRGEVDAALEGRDGLLLPSLGVPATRLGAATVRAGHTDEPVRNIMLRLTQLFNITGHPAISMPCGRTVEGLPIGLQIVGPRHTTMDLLRVAAAIEPCLVAGTTG